jgi:hypothetical protein
VVAVSTSQEVIKGVQKFGRSMTNASQLLVMTALMRAKKRPVRVTREVRYEGNRITCSQYLLPETGE